MKWTRKILLFLIYAHTLVLLFSCSSSTNYQILSTFFDGVPDPNAKPKAIVDSIKVDSLAALKRNKIRLIEEDEFIFHPPYRNRLCKDCHNVNVSNELIKPVPDLCYKCHENFAERNPSLHGPVAMGDCQVCHSAHFTKNKFLLKRTGRDLCLHCHEKTYVFENKHHFATEEYQCLDCHNPHSGKDRFLLNES